MDQLVENFQTSYNDLNDADSDSETNPEQLLNEWLGELDTLTVGLDSVSSTGELKPLNSEISVPRIDSYRFSMANLEDSQDVDLDAILGELCALEMQCDQEIDRSKRASQNDATRQHLHHSRSSSESNRCLKLDPGESELMLKHHQHPNDGGSTRTDSPDNDSAFSDTVSMLSSESSASSGASGNKSHLLIGSQDAAGRAKAEKIRMALEKMKEASIKKLFIKAFTIDGSTKSLLVDEKMTCGYVTRLLADKNHVQMDPKWAIVEYLPDLFMERIYEDHELLVENLMHWTRDSKNKIIFVERLDKTHLFLQPENYLVAESDNSSRNIDYDDDARNMLLEEFFSSTSNTVPEVEGPLYLKSDSKKGWKKYQFVLRASGLYYWPKDKVKGSSRDLICLATFDVNQVYYGVGWRKKYKAPTDFCFAIKHPRLQQSKSTKYIKYLCTDDQKSLERWMVGIRIAIHGRHLMDNYRLLVDDLAQDDLDLLAHARSCSVSSIAMSVPQANLIPPAHNIYSGGSDTSSGRHSRASSSSSSGCLSDGASSSCENAFDSEISMGTIKRKPSMKPSLPLTSITRQLKEVGETRDPDTENNISCPSPNNSLTGSFTNSGTLTRRHSRRKSSTHDDSSNSGTLKRQHLRSRGSVESMKSGNNTPVSPSSRDRSSPFFDLSPSQSITNNLITSNGILQNSNIMTESLTSLPPPPPDPPGLLSDQDEPLPPPPPELFRSNLSLDSLPPPPAPEEMSIYNGSENISSSQLSLMSLPPPPGSETNTIKRKFPSQTPINNSINSESCRSPVLSQSPDVTPTHSRLNTPYFNSSPGGSNCSTPTHINSPSCGYSPTRLQQQSTYATTTNNHQAQYALYPGAIVNGQNHSRIDDLIEPAYISTPIYNNSRPPSIERNPSILRSSIRQTSLPRQVSTHSISSTNSSNSSSSNASPYFTELQVKQSPQMSKKVNFQEPSSPNSKKPTKKITFNLPNQEQRQEAPPIPKKPPPPKRSEKTKLTSPKKLCNSASAPPTDFLKDLQRVMRKKWQVAQKCKLEPATTPHEVLGFRDPPPAIADYRETNVSNWVQEHYGVDNLYENVYTNNTPENIIIEYANPLTRNMSMNENQIIRSKRPPPPPPKRSETTQLTTQKLY